MKLPEDNWLVKTNSFLIGDFMCLMLIGWQRNN